MIYIYDNGESYSDHSICFVESDWPNTEEVVALINACGKRDNNEAHVIGVGTFEWRDRDATTTLEWFAHPENFVDRGYRKAVSVGGLSRSLLRHIAEAWARNSDITGPRPHGNMWIAEVERLRREWAAE